LASRETDEQVAEAVLAYLSEAPDAMDTAGGVTEWWLTRQRVRNEVEVVARVLDTLVARGALEVIETPLQRCYRLARPRHS
jgi:hypothetical protein